MELYEQGYGLEDYGASYEQEEVFDHKDDTNHFERVVYVTIALLAIVSAVMVYITFV